MAVESALALGLRSIRIDLVTVASEDFKDASQSGKLQTCIPHSILLCSPQQNSLSNLDAVSFDRCQSTAEILFTCKMFACHELMLEPS